MSMFSLVNITHLLFDHFQFALIHGPNIPSSYAILLFRASDFTAIPSQPQLGVVFALAPFFHSSWSYFSTDLQWHIEPTNLGSSSFSVLSFCLFILFMRFSRQEYWSGLPFPSPVDHVLSELSTMTRPSWVALHRHGS